MYHLTSARAVRSGPAPVSLPGPALTYIICTNPRSGSWLLSDGLAATGVAGNPREWFSFLEEQQHRARWRMDHQANLSYPSYLRLACAESTSSNGISGIKLHYYQLAELPENVAAIDGLRGLAPGPLMRRLFPGARYIWLTRRDKARQAISLRLAASTGQWWSADGTLSAAPEAGAMAPEFDAAAIASLERTFTERDSDWQDFFARAAIRPLVLHYEDLVRDYQGVIARVLDWLGVPGSRSADIQPPRLRRQSDERNEDWLRRYVAARRDGLDPAPDAARDPLGARIRQGRDAVPGAWREWIARSKLSRASDDAISEVLTSNGYSSAAAAAELGRAAADPYLLAAARAQQGPRRAESLLAIQAQLAQLSSHARAVDRRSGLSRAEFRDEYYAAGRPVIMSGLMTGWKALTAWTPEYLKAVAGDQTVEVMTGREADPNYERNARRHRTDMRFADYIDLVHSGRVTNDYHLVARNAFLQHPAARPLRPDFPPFPEYLRPAAAGPQSFLWFGPAGTVTPLHHDFSNLLLAQVSGRKRIRLVPAAERSCVYPRGVFSEVDAEAPDLARYPAFRQATVIDVVIQPGEVLFVPVGWWHHVRALDVSMTLSFTKFVFPNHFTWEQPR
jgi:LPS sulfotransferase NodH